MIKKLVLSTLTVGVVAAALGYGVFAFFLNESTTAVEVTAADGLDITYDIDLNCDGSYDAENLLEIPANTSVGPAYPGDVNSACVRVDNNNPTDVNVYVQNDTFNDDAGGAFIDVLYGQVDNVTLATTPCGLQLVDGAGFTSANSNRGCLLANVAANSSSDVFEVSVLFYDDNTDQSVLAGKVATWNSNLNAYTTAP